MLLLLLRETPASSLGFRIQFDGPKRASAAETPGRFCIPEHPNHSCIALKQKVQMWVEVLRSVRGHQIFSFLWVFLFLGD